MLLIVSLLRPHTGVDDVAANSHPPTAPVLQPPIEIPEDVLATLTALVMEPAHVLAALEKGEEAALEKGQEGSGGSGSDGGSGGDNGSIGSSNVGGVDNSSKGDAMSDGRCLFFLFVVAY